MQGPRSGPVGHAAAGGWARGPAGEEPRYGDEAASRAQQHGRRAFARLESSGRVPMHVTPVALWRACAAMHIPAGKGDPAAPVAPGPTSPDSDRGKRRSITAANGFAGPSGTPTQPTSRKLSGASNQ